MPNKFSIITPTYNREDLVQTTINSIINQTFTDWELLIIDDGSTDNTEQAIRQYLEDPRIKYIKKKNSGQADSLNVGVSHATGKFITFLDSDDEAYSNWLEIVNQNINEETSVICVCAIRKLIDGTLVPERLSEITLMGERIKFKFTCGSLFMERSVFSAIGGYDSEMRSNIQTDLGYRLLNYLQSTKRKIVALEDQLVQINIHNGPRIRTDWGKIRDGSIRLLQKHHKFIGEINPKDLSNICAVIAFANYKLKDRKQSVLYLLKAIRHEPYRTANYLRVFKYAFM